MYGLRIFVAGLVVATLLLSLGAVTTNANVPHEPVRSSGPADYANGWTHRPVMELFTSLSCPPCMANSDPFISQLYEETRDDPAVPWIFVGFHQRNGGNADDIFAIQEARDRYDDYSVAGTPDAIFDGGYIESIKSGDGYDEYKQAFADSGERDVKPTTLKVYQEFKGDKFDVMVNLTYLGDGGIHDPFINPDDFNPRVDIYMVEDDIWAYSSELEEETWVYNVYRGTALEDWEPGTMAPGDYRSMEVSWEIPDTVVFPSGHKDYDGNPYEGEQDIPMPVNPANTYAVAVVYDLDDTSSQHNGQGKDKNTPRAVNAASPGSTAYDEGVEPPQVEQTIEIYQDSGAALNISFDSENGIGSAYVIYNYESPNSTGAWGTLELAVTGEEICDEAGVCYAFDNAFGTTSIPYNGDDEIYYRVIAVDGNSTFGVSDTYHFEGKDGGAPPGDEGGVPLWLMGVALGGIGLAGFAIWATRPAVRSQEADILEGQKV